jgi:hypothetical protein
MAAAPTIRQTYLPSSTWQVNLRPDLHCAIHDLASQVLICDLSSLTQIRRAPHHNPLHTLLCLIKIQVLYYSAFTTRHETRSEVPMSCSGSFQVSESLWAGISIRGDDGRELLVDMKNKLVMVMLKLV